jgi:Na+:H+ antiporter, NhaA family
MMQKTRVSKLFLEFIGNERTGGMVLVLAAIVSMIISNSSLGAHYTSFWSQSVDFSLFGTVPRHTVAEWVNNGLMTVFFLLVGLEIERELYEGELSEVKNALLPIAAAMGGMIIPALIHFAFNGGTATQSGFGIPMATDIAFSLGALSLVGKKVPVSLKVFLTALAIIDDLGAIVVVAFFMLGIFLSCFSPVRWGSLPSLS